MRKLTEIFDNGILTAIGESYERAIRETVDAFEDTRSSEDRVTGSLTTPFRRVAGEIDAQRYSPGNPYPEPVKVIWKTRVISLGDRGEEAAETRLGADAVLEIRVKLESNETIAVKSIPIQGKKNTTAWGQRILDQAEKLKRFPGESLVVEYGPNGFRATSAKNVVAAQGKKRKVKRDAWAPLGQRIKDEFLQCTIGANGWEYDPEAEVFRKIPEEDTLSAAAEIIFDSEELVETIIEVRPR